MLAESLTPITSLASHLPIGAVVDFTAFLVVRVSQPPGGAGSPELPNQAILWVRRPQQPTHLDPDNEDKPEEQNPIPNHILQAVSSPGWDRGVPGKARNTEPIKMSLKP